MCRKRLLFRLKRNMIVFFQAAAIVLKASFR
jgi:hypothetical protein